MRCLRQTPVKANPTISNALIDVTLNPVAGAVALNDVFWTRMLS